MKKILLCKKPITLALSLLFLINGCAAANKSYSLSEGNLVTKGDKIYYDSKIFAELRYFRDGSDNENIRGFAIYYYESDKEVWIYPKNGWHIEHYGKGVEYHSISDIDRIWRGERDKARLLLGNKSPTKGEFISTWCFDVRISTDYKYIYYKTPGIFFDSSHKYLVEYGKR